MSLLFFFMLVLFCGCKCPETENRIPAVRNFQPERYMGVWHEAARMPHNFEKGLDFVTAEYTLLPDGTIRVRNCGSRRNEKRIVTGMARQKQAGTGELEVSFFRPFWGTYRIAALDPEYRAALVISSGKNSAWILVRDPETASRWITKYTALLKLWGFDCEKLEYPKMSPKPQLPERHNSMHRTPCRS